MASSTAAVLAGTGAGLAPLGVTEGVDERDAEGVGVGVGVGDGVADASSSAGTPRWRRASWRTAACF